MAAKKKDEGMHGYRSSKAKPVKLTGDAKLLQSLIADQREWVSKEIESRFLQIRVELENKLAFTPTVAHRFAALEQDMHVNMRGLLMHNPTLLDLEARIQRLERKPVALPAPKKVS